MGGKKLIFVDTRVVCNVLLWIWRRGPSLLPGIAPNLDRENIYKPVNVEVRRDGKVNSLRFNCGGYAGQVCQGQSCWTKSNGWVPRSLDPC